MSPYNKEKEEQRIKDIIKEKINVLMSDRNISRHNEIYNKIPAFSQPQFSRVFHGESLPTLMQLIGLANFFNVSLDYLIDRAPIEEKKDLSLADYCKLLVNLINSDLNMSISEISVTETREVYVQTLIEYPEPHYIDDFEEEDVVNKYNALFFSKSVSNNTEKRNSDDLTPRQKATIINTFLDRVSKFRMLYQKNDLTKEEFDLLINGSLKKVIEDEENFRQKNSKFAKELIPIPDLDIDLPFS